MWFSLRGNRSVLSADKESVEIQSLSIRFCLYDRKNMHRLPLLSASLQHSHRIYWYSLYSYILSLIFSEFLTAFGRGWPFKVSTGDQRHSLVCLLFYFWKPDFEKINHASRPSLRLAEAVLVSTAFTLCPRPRCSLQKTRPERGRSASAAATQHWQW